jgi:hypothetical protein
MTTFRSDGMSFMKTAIAIQEAKDRDEARTYALASFWRYRELVSQILDGFDDLGAIQGLRERTPAYLLFEIDRLEAMIWRLNRVEKQLRRRQRRVLAR